MTGGAALVQAAIESLDQLAAWEPDGLADVLGTLAELPGLLGAAGEAVAVTALTAEETRTAHPQAVVAAEEAARWVSSAADGLGSTYSRWTFLRSGSAARWLPPGRSAA